MFDYSFFLSPLLLCRGFLHAIIFFPLLLQRKHHTNSRSKNEMIISHKEVTSSVNPHKQPQAVKEASKDLLEHQRKKVSYSGPLVHGTTKVSHSGPLVHGTTWAKAGKGHDDPPVVSTRSNLSTLSGFVASRTVAPKDRLEKFGPSQLGTVKQVGGSQRSYNDLVSAGKQDYRHNNQRTAESPQGFGKATIKEPNLVSYLTFFFAFKVLNSKQHPFSACLLYS